MNRRQHPSERATHDLPGYMRAYGAKRYADLRSRGRCIACRDKSGMFSRCAECRRVRAIKEAA
jgi:hypothetical protein